MLGCLQLHLISYHLILHVVVSVLVMLFLGLDLVAMILALHLCELHVYFPLISNTFVCVVAHAAASSHVFPTIAAVKYTVKLGCTPTQLEVLKIEVLMRWQHKS